MDQAKFDTGLEARRRVLGDEYVDRAFDTADAFNIEFQKMVTEYCWGEVWGRTALSDQQRSLNNLCILASLNRSARVQVHFRGALRNGCTLDELRDTLVQVMVYAGVPAGVEAFRLAREVLEDEGHRARPQGERHRMSDDSALVIGFVGLGNMGAPMAANVAAAGFDVVGFDAAGTEGSTARRAVPAADRSPRSSAAPTRSCSACPTARSRWRSPTRSSAHADRRVDAS